MQIRLTILLSLLISMPIFADSRPDFDPSSQREKLACLLERPLIFGASVSAGYSGVSDATAALAKLKASEVFGTDSHYLGANPDPVTRLARKYSRDPKVTNIAEIINQMQYGSIGPMQFLKYISASTENYENAKSSTVLASIDGLYWPTIYGDDCYVTERAIEWTRDIIQFGKENGIPLLLGNVPEEDASKVSALLKASGGWSSPKSQCLKMVNEFLATECLVDQQCYVIDMYRIIENLKGTLSPYDRSGIWYKGKNYEYNDFREDGVHLFNSPRQANRNGASLEVPVGMRYAMTYIEKAIAWNLPACK